MTDRQIELRDNYFRVLENIEAAKAHRGENKEVQLLAATKTVPAEDVLFLVENYGLKLCGENHAQEFIAKADLVKNAGARMDFIGHLQTNKVKYIAGKAGLVHSLDSVRLAAELDKQCAKLGTTQDVLVEINIGSEDSKTGIAPTEVERFLEEISAFPTLSVRGMMTMAPKCEEISEFRKYFRESYRIFLDFFAKKTHNIGEAVLSMGMSDSYACAIEEGSDIVRVGSAIFGSRNYK
ncbi:MAG: YggS family pyridoxal phosphate-dependent enzyme [Clostridia bacterium]|nr:YggS family pyridoxal phosphate-dependent enzyme [Clostridia bacterium]